MQAIAIASAGIMSAFSRFDASVQRSANGALDDIAAETVERMEAKTEVKANAAVLRTADDMMGTLLDILA